MASGRKLRFFIASSYRADKPVANSADIAQSSEPRAWISTLRNTSTPALNSSHSNCVQYPKQCITLTEIGDVRRESSFFCARYTDQRNVRAKLVDHRFDV
jgi:hypothetical protein